MDQIQVKIISAELGERIVEDRFNVLRGMEIVPKLIDGIKSIHPTFRWGIDLPWTLARFVHVGRHSLSELALLQLHSGQILRAVAEFCEKGYVPYKSTLRRCVDNQRSMPSVTLSIVREKRINEHTLTALPTSPVPACHTPIWAK